MTGERVWTRLTTGALLLGGVHACVDCGSAFLIVRDAYRAPFSFEVLVYLAVLYNSVAFGGQALLGLVADRWRNYRLMAMVGALLVALALGIDPLAAPLGNMGSTVILGVAIVGLGNAMFHVGAGAFVLGESGARSTESGVFVGPGALGLAAGLLMGAHGVPARWAVVVLLGVGAASVLWITRWAQPRQAESSVLPPVRSGFYLVAVAAAVCLVASVTVRSLIGGALAGSWRGVSTSVLTGLAFAACFGKMLGGFIGDRFGWANVSVAALVLSAPLVSWYALTPVGAVVGMLIFQLTMPMTLKATHHILPSRPGLAFGIPCFALLLGALPGLLRPLPGFGFLQPLPTWVHVLACVLVSAVLVFLGLRLMRSSGAHGGPRSPRTPDEWLAGSRDSVPQPAE